ncbi:MAG: hypothetical protein ACLFPQ_06880, partial [Candidatus Woesearchaeota archaeon]
SKIAKQEEQLGKAEEEKEAIQKTMYEFDSLYNDVKKVQRQFPELTPYEISNYLKNEYQKRKEAIAEYEDQKRKKETEQSKVRNDIKEQKNNLEYQFKIDIAAIENKKGQIESEIEKIRNDHNHELIQKKNELRQEKRNINDNISKLKYQYEIEITNINGKMRQIENDIKKIHDDHKIELGQLEAGHKEEIIKLEGQRQAFEKLWQAKETAITKNEEDAARKIALCMDMVDNIQVLDERLKQNKTKQDELLPALELLDDFAGKYGLLDPGSVLKNKREERARFNGRRQRHQGKIDRLSQIIVDLEGKSVAPGNISRQAFGLLPNPETGRYLWEVIEEVGLEQETKSRVLTSLSSLIFTPVVSDPEGAEILAAKLSEKEIPVPVLHAEEVKKALVSHQLEDLSRAVCGHHSEAVDLLLHPEKKEIEKKRLRRKISILQKGLQALKTHLDTLSEDFSEMVFLQEAERAHLSNKRGQYEQLIQEEKGLFLEIEKFHKKAKVTNSDFLDDDGEVITVENVKNYLQKSISGFEKRQIELSDEKKSLEAENQANLDKLEVAQGELIALLEKNKVSIEEQKTLKINEKKEALSLCEEQKIISAKQRDDKINTLNDEINKLISEHEKTISKLIDIYNNVKADKQKKANDCESEKITLTKQKNDKLREIEVNEKKMISELDGEINNICRLLNTSQRQMEEFDRQYGVSSNFSVWLRNAISYYEKGGEDEHNITKEKLSTVSLNIKNIINVIETSKENKSEEKTSIVTREIEIKSEKAKLNDFDFNSLQVVAESDEGKDISKLEQEISSIKNTKYHVLRLFNHGFEEAHRYIESREEDEMAHRQVNNSKESIERYRSERLNMGEQIQEIDKQLGQTKEISLICDNNLFSIQRESKKFAALLEDLGGLTTAETIQNKQEVESIRKVVQQLENIGIDMSLGEINSLIEHIDFTLQSYHAQDKAEKAKSYKGKIDENIKSYKRECQKFIDKEGENINTSIIKDITETMSNPEDIKRIYDITRKRVEEEQQGREHSQKIFDQMWNDQVKRLTAMAEASKNSFRWLKSICKKYSDSATFIIDSKIASNEDIEKAVEDIREIVDYNLTEVQREGKRNNEGKKSIEDRFEKRKEHIVSEVREKLYKTIYKNPTIKIKHPGIAKGRILEFKRNVASGGQG